MSRKEAVAASDGDNETESDFQNVKDGIDMTKKKRNRIER